MKLFHRIVAAVLLSSGAAIAFAGAPTPQSSNFVVDVALDGRTWRLDDGTNPIWPVFTGAFGRGNTFIVSGNIYAAGTLMEGGDLNAPGNPEGPDLPNPIGTWVCRGTFNFDFGDIANGAVPHVTSTQFFYFNDGSVIITEGPEGGTTTLRSVLGGAGRYSAAKGDVSETPLGVNDSNLFNVRLSFSLK